MDSLLNPSKKVDPKFATYTLVTAEGKVLNGLLVERNKKEVILNVLMDGRPQRVRVAADDVDVLQVQKKSLMPDRLLRDLTAQQAADLLDFLTSLKTSPPPDKPQR